MDILADLRKNICEVTFTKANGDERVMICTLIPSYLPVLEYEPVTSGRTVSDLITVWDVEENAWRSFKPSKIVDIKFSPE